MNEINKQMLDAWIRFTLLPIVEGAIRSRIPLRSIAGALAAAAVRAALKAPMKREELMALIEETWDRQSKTSKT